MALTPAELAMRQNGGAAQGGTPLTPAQLALRQNGGATTFTAQPGQTMFGNAPAGGGKGGGAQTVTAQPGQPLFGGPTPSAAPATPAPTAGGQTQGTPNVFQQANNSLTGAINGTNAAMNYNPMMVNPATLAHQNLNAYMNPYQQSVINTTMQGLRQQKAQAVNDLDAQASAAGAFGGSRHGVALGATNGEYADTQAATLANLNSANYNQAQHGAMFDAGVKNNARQFNAGQGNFGANLGMQGAAQLGNLSNLGFGQGMQINGQQGAQGAQQQALQQAIMNAAMQQFGGFTGAPGQSLGTLLGGVGGVPYGTSGTNTTTQNPGIFDWLSLGLSI